jgi:peptidoglycan hydrolase CwlO-like protein
MRKTFLVLCIVALVLLGLNVPSRRTATADSDFAVGDLSKIAEQLGVVPEETGKYSLASILEALYASVESTNKQASGLGTTITELSSSISSLRLQVRIIRQEALGVSLDQLNELADWTESELNRLWGSLQRIENEFGGHSGSYLESRLQWLESSIRQIERALQGINTTGNDYRLRQIESSIQQIEWELNNLQCQINSLRR